MGMRHTYCTRPSSFPFEDDVQWAGTYFHFSDSGDGELISRDDV